MNKQKSFDYKTKPDQYAELAPDESEIRLLPSTKRGKAWMGPYLLRVIGNDFLKLYLQKE